MALETFNYLDSLVPDNPVVSDGLVNGDDHIRGIKLALKNTFPNLTGPVTLTQAILNALNIDSGVKSGALMDFATPTAPSGWLACDGQAVSRTTYATLFTAIGTTWGAGDGSTTFNVPPLMDRFRRHRNAAGLAGAVGTLQSPANLTHSHAVTGAPSAGSLSTDSQGAHTHGINDPGHSHTVDSPGEITPNTAPVGVVVGVNPWGAVWNMIVSVATTGISILSGGAHTHNITGAPGVGSLGTAAQGDASEARPYSATVLTCIKT